MCQPGYLIVISTTTIMPKHHFCDKCSVGCSRYGDLKRHILLKHMDASMPMPTPMPAPMLTPTPTSMPAPMTTPTPAPMPTPMPMPTPTPMPAPMPAPMPTLCLYKRWQTLFDKMKATIPNIQFREGIPHDLDSDTILNAKRTNSVIIDDLMTDIKKDSTIQDLFTVGSHHPKLSVICLLQNVYFPGTQTMRYNFHYVVLCNMPADKRQISSMSTQMYPENPQHMLRAYEEAIKIPYGYLLVDLKPDTPSSEPLMTQVFQDERVDKSEHKKSLYISNGDEYNDSEERKEEDEEEEEEPEQSGPLHPDVWYLMAWTCIPFVGDSSEDYPIAWIPFLKAMARIDFD